MNRRSRSGRSAGPLQVNSSAWSLVRERPATGSPDRSRGRMRSLGTTPARRLLSGQQLLSIRGGGGSGIVPRPPGHKLLKSS